MLVWYNSQAKLVDAHNPIYLFQSRNGKQKALPTDGLLYLEENVYKFVRIATLTKAHQLHRLL